jgi:hypothetical protein
VVHRTSTRDSNELLTERCGGRVVSGRRKRAIQQAARWACHPWEKETGNSVSGTAGKASARERNEQFSKQLTGVLSAEERNERLSKLRGWRVYSGRKIRAIQQAVRRACRQREKETSHTASVTAGQMSTSTRNNRRRQRNVVRDIDDGNKRSMQ